MIGKKDKFWGSSEKPSALELRWRRVADCSRGGFQPQEMYDCQQWPAVHVRRIISCEDDEGRRRQL